MPPVTLTPALRQEYERLFNAMDIVPARQGTVDRLCDGIVADRARYAAVERSSGVPWPFVAVVHNMEADRRFDRHLHNGDPLTARTRQVPAGRPKSGAPPFTWEVSCADALACRSLSGANDWSLGGMLYQLEGYNGWGYRRFHPHVLSPYLWSFSSHYDRGKYVADGRWSDDARSAQCGAAVLLRRLAERGAIHLADQPAPPPPAAAEPMVRYSAARPKDAAAAARAEDLQRWLNTFPGIFVKVDGAPGQRTSDAYRRVTGHLLPGDPRVA